MKNPLGRMDSVLQQLYQFQFFLSNLPLLEAVASTQSTHNKNCISKTTEANDRSCNPLP